jgi:hypothetical protein
VKGFCGDGRAVIQRNSFPDTEQILKVTGFPGSGGCSLSGPLTVLSFAIHKYLAYVSGQTRVLKEATGKLHVKEVEITESILQVKNPSGKLSGKLDLGCIGMIFWCTF